VDDGEDGGDNGEDGGDDDDGAERGRVEQCRSN
jgi:hypothetical protein